MADARSIALLTRIVPLLQVANVAEALRYYREMFGFGLDYAWPDAQDPQWAQVSRGPVSFIFTIDLGTSSGRFIAEKGNGVVFYLITAQVEAFYDELVQRGAIIVQELRDFGGRKQFSVADLNGYVLAFSQEFA